MYIPFQDDKNPKRWRCSNCGSAVAKVWNFCQHCGEMIDCKNIKEHEMNNALKFEEVFGMNLIDLFSMKEYRYKDYLNWLNKAYEEPKSDAAEYQKPPLGKQPDYIDLSFTDLLKMVGQPVFVVYPKHDDTAIRGCDIMKVKYSEDRQWEVLTGLRKTESHEYVLFRGAYDWIEIGNVKIYRNEGDANESA